MTNIVTFNNTQNIPQIPSAISSQEIIPVFTTVIGDKSVQATNARELHSFLGVKQEFSKWIKKRIEQYGFIENKDYVTVVEKCERQLLSQYNITLQMAKELCMVEKTSKGKEAREYFLDCEERANQAQEAQTTIANMSVPEQFLRAAQMLVEEVKKNEILTGQLTEKEELIDSFIDNGNNDLLSLVARALGVSEKRFFKDLRDNKILYQRGGVNVPYAKYINLGYFTVKETAYTKRGGETGYSKQTLVTPKGEVFLAEFFMKKNGKAPSSLKLTIDDNQGKLFH